MMQEEIDISYWIVLGDVLLYINKERTLLSHSYFLSWHDDLSI